MFKRMIRSKFWMILLLAAILLAVVVLIPRKEETPSNFEEILHDPVCQAPCWQGITPGETEAEAAVDILQNSDKVDQSSLSVSKTKDGYNYRYYQSSLSLHKAKDGSKYHAISFETTDGQGAQFAVVDGKVAVLSLFIVSTRLEQVLQELGEPDRMLIENWSVTPLCDFTGYLFYPDAGVAIETWFSPVDKCGDPLAVAPDNVVTGVYYFQPGNVDEFINFTYKYNNPDKKFDLEAITYPWQGYQELELRPAPEFY